MKCPNCNETLVMTDRQGVEIDYCPKCRGVWLDKGELDKIIERSASYQAPDTSYEEKKYGDSDKHYQDPQHKHRKRKGFLGDLFDFD